MVHGPWSKSKIHDKEKGLISKIMGQDLRPRVNQYQGSRFKTRGLDPRRERSNTKNQGLRSKTNVQYQIPRVKIQDQTKDQDPRPRIKIKEQYSRPRNTIQYQRSKSKTKDQDPRPKIKIQDQRSRSKTKDQDLRPKIKNQD